MPARSQIVTDHAALTAALDQAAGALAGPTERLSVLRDRRVDVSERLRAANLAHDEEASAKAMENLQAIDISIEKAIAALVDARADVAAKYSAVIKKQFQDLCPRLEDAAAALDEARERMWIICRHSTARQLGIPHLAGTLPPTDQIKHFAKRLAI